MTQGKPYAPRPEFSRPVDVSRLERPELHEIEADAGERAALAARFGVTAVDRLVAKLAVRQVAGGPLIRVSGRFEADIEQPCVVTLEPVRSRVEDEVEIEFGPATEAPVGDVDVAEEADLPEPLEGDEIDLGEIVAQFLSVSIDPYPRAPGAALERQTFEGPETKENSNDGAASDSPFAVLKSLQTPEK